MSISKPIPLGYKEGFEDMDQDHNGKLDAKEVFNMMKQVRDLGPQQKPIQSTIV